MDRLYPELAALVPKKASKEAEEPTSRAAVPPTQESMWVGGCISGPLQTDVPSKMMLNSASFDVGQLRSITSILMVVPESFVISHSAMVLVREKLPMSMSGQTSCVGVGVIVGVRVEVAVGDDVRVGVAVGVAVRVGVCVAVGECVVLATGETLSASVTVAVRVREIVGVLVDVLIAEAVSVSVRITSGVPSSAGGGLGLSDPLDSINHTCSVAAIAV